MGEIARTLADYATGLDCERGFHPTATCGEPGLPGPVAAEVAR